MNNMQRLTMHDESGATVLRKAVVSDTDILDRLAAYEDLFESWDLKGFDFAELEKWHERMIFHVKKTNELSDALQAASVNPQTALWAEADKEGRLLVIPCKPFAEVFAIQENYFDCENCPNKEKVKYCKEIARFACDEAKHCPYYIEQHEAEGFKVVALSKDKMWRWMASPPGEWGYEGLEEYRGIDGKHYYSKKEAEAALERLNGESQ